MPFSRPSLTSLVERGRDDINARMPGADSRLRRSALDVLGRGHAGVAHGLYGYIEWVSRQILPDTADIEQLKRWASIFGLTLKPAAPAEGLVAMAGTNGAVIPAAAVLQRGDGAEYVVTDETTIALGVADVPVIAATPGLAGLASAGVKLTLTSPIAGVVASGVVAEAGLSGGADQESVDELRSRLLDRIRQVPMGGAENDYERWGREVSGVTRVWVYPNLGGLGKVGVAFAMDGREDIIPESGDVAAVAAYIAPRRPVTADVTVFAPEADEIDFSITLTPDTTAARDAVEAELRDLFRREAEPGGTVLISHVREAISTAAGETDHVLTSPTANIVSDPGDLAVLGAVTWG